MIKRILRFLVNIPGPCCFVMMITSIRVFCGTEYIYCFGPLRFVPEVATAIIMTYVHGNISEKSGPDGKG